MHTPVRSRRLLGSILITIGLVLISISIAQIERSDSAITPIPIVDRVPTIVTPSLAPTSQSTSTSTPTLAPVTNPVPTAENSRTPTVVGHVIPTKIIATITPRPTESSSPTARIVPVSGGLYSTRQRIGLALGSDERAPGRLQTLLPGFYLAWGLATVGDAGPNIQYLPMVRLLHGKPRLDLALSTHFATAHPGSLWLIGNEPDVVWQDNSTPEEYAAGYHTVYAALKAADPTSRIAIGGVSQPTPLRLQYLDRVLAAYQDQFGAPMPIDVWNVHNFILNEQHGSWGVDIPPGFAVAAGTLHTIDQHDDMQIFRQQIIAFRQWMAAHGYRDKELIVSEYGILMPLDYGFDTARVRDFMNGTFDFFLTATNNSIGLPGDGNRLVQRWCWFSLSDSDYPSGNLIDFDSGQITPLGQDFITYLQTH
jgi:hypothetical protein